MEQQFSYRDMQKYTDVCFQSTARIQFLGIKKWCKKFFWYQLETSAGKLLKSERFLAVLREHIFLNVKWVEVHKWVKFFGQNSTVKWVISFASFCWLWHFLLENLKLKRISDNIHWNVWRNIKKFYAWNSIFKKKEKKKIQIWDFESFIFWSKESFIFYILGTALEHFGQCVFFFIFCRQPTMVVNIFTQPFHHKKVSYDHV